jgi:hypothetical protein
MGRDEVNVIDRRCEQQGFVRKFFCAQATNPTKICINSVSQLEGSASAVSPARSKQVKKHN